MSRKSHPGRRKTFLTIHEWRKENTVTLKITDKALITATGTKHIALATGDGLWRVSWPPGQELNRNGHPVPDRL